MLDALHLKLRIRHTEEILLRILHHSLAVEGVCTTRGTTQLILLLVSETRVWLIILTERQGCLVVVRRISKQTTARVLILLAELVVVLRLLPEW